MRWPIKSTGWLISLELRKFTRVDVNGIKLIIQSSAIAVFPPKKKKRKKKIKKTRKTPKKPGKKPRKPPKQIGLHFKAFELKIFFSNIFHI